MFNKLKNLKDTMNNAAGNASDMKDTVTSFAKDLSERVPTASDVIKLLAIIDRVPFIKKRKVDNDLLKDSLAIIQTSKVAFIIALDKKGNVDASFAKLDKAVSEEVKSDPDNTDFDVSKLGEDDEASLDLTINSKKFMEDPTKVTTELFVSTALGVVCSTPIIGGVLKKILHKPVLKIATFIVGAIQNTAGSAVDFVSEKKEANDNKGPKGYLGTGQNK